MLGGVNVPSDRGCIAHSDGDVLLHALMDAMLGAAGLRDIGWYFPDNSEEFRGIDSKKLLLRVKNLIHEQGFRVGNIDLTVLLERPKIRDFIPLMQQQLASLLDISPLQIGIKAGTNEGVGEVGQGTAIAAWAVVLLERK